MVTDWTHAKASRARTGLQISDSQASRIPSPHGTCTLPLQPWCCGHQPRGGSLPAFTAPTVSPCASGFYCPEGSGEPTLYPPPMVTAALGAKQQEDCGPCPPGNWCRVSEVSVLQPGMGWSSEGHRKGGRMESIRSPSSARTWSPTPALPAASALEGERPTQTCLRPALTSPVWHQKEARVEPSASPALPHSTAHPQVRGRLQLDAEASGEERREDISRARRASLLCLLLLPPGRSSSKPTCVCQAAGVQVIRVPFSAHLAPFRKNQGFHLWKAVSSALLAPTAQRLS